MITLIIILIVAYIFVGMITTMRIYNTTEHYINSADRNLMAAFGGILWPLAIMWWLAALVYKLLFKEEPEDEAI